MFSFSDSIHSIRFKLIASLIAVSLVIGLISVLVGGNLLYQSVIDEANSRIRQDLNVARVIYDDRVDAVRLALEITASGPSLGSALLTPDEQRIARLGDMISLRLGLDFLGVTDAQGRILHRHGTGNAGKGPDPADDPGPNALVSAVLAGHQAVSGTIRMNIGQLAAENPSLADPAKIRIQPGPGGARANREPFALVMGAAVPIAEGGQMAGVIYGGYLLNRDTHIVDKIGKTVFKNQVYKGRNVGTATIFCDDLRIATSVKDDAGQRAVGTFASPKVARQVLDEGKNWTDRATVLDDWYITAYEPITDIAGKRIGMLYVGVLEAQYADVRRNAISLFTGITVAGVGIAIVLGWIFTGRIMQPLTRLIRASNEISSGNFSPDIGPVSRDDIGQLQKAFLTMVDALKERERRQKAESETRLMQSEKQASVGKLAAGVAHEINNPLTAVLTFTHLMLRRKDLPEAVRTDLETVAAQTERVRKIVKSLLDFSRQTQINPEPLDINRLVEDSAGLLKNQARLRRVDLSFEGDRRLPAFTLDRNQCQSALINIMINALDATPEGGKIRVLTRQADMDGGSGVDIEIADTGTGIPPEHMDELFDPFFTTKPLGKGTGLGLAVTAGIVERHGGTITVRSKPGRGTTFTIRLPRLQAPGPSGAGSAL